MHLHHNISGWMLLFALLTFAVICDALGLWMSWLATH
jgi:hypothetical protein